MAELTDAERVFTEALRTVRAKLMDTITSLDDTIAEVEQAAAARDKLCDCGPPGGPAHDESLHAPILPNGATFIGETSDGGYTYRNLEGRLVKVHANGQRTFPIKDNPQA